MSTPASHSSPAEAAKNVTPGFEENLRQFWERNQKLLIALGIIILIAIVARGSWDFVAGQKERQVQQDYAAAATPAQLQAFANAHPGHELAGIAWLQLGDQAYAAGKGADAVTDYQKAAAVLKAGPLADRTSLGLAMAQIQAGQADAGQAGLKALVDRDSAFKGVRVEAAYQLASLAHTAGQAGAVKHYADRIMQIDPSSPWSQRVLTLRSDEPEQAPAATAAAPADSAKPAEAKPDSVIKLNLPAK
jgi:predicted negative regulator of RcsB-dependent stress response